MCTWWSMNSSHTQGKLWKLHFSASIAVTNDSLLFPSKTKCFFPGVNRPEPTPPPPKRLNYSKQSHMLPNKCAGYWKLSNSTYLETVSWNNTSLDKWTSHLTISRISNPFRFPSYGPFYFVFYPAPSLRYQGKIRVRFENMAGASDSNTEHKCKLIHLGRVFQMDRCFRQCFYSSCRNSVLWWFWTRRVLLWITSSYCVRCDQVGERTGLGAGSKVRHRMVSDCW